LNELNELKAGSPAPCGESFQPAPRYQAVFFDAGQTLIDARLDRPARFLHFAAEWGLSVEPVAGRAAHLRLWRQHFGERYPEGNQSTTDALCLAFYRDLLDDLHVPDEEDETAARLVTACDYRYWMVPYPDAAAGLARLQGACRLALLSNAPPSLRGLLDQLGLARYFDYMVISGEVDVRKPDPGIYLLALASLGVRPEESLFVDDLEENLVVARQIGMGCLLMDRRDAQPPTAFRRVTDMEGVTRELFPGT
jgi:HAD superfamily hydrolase (TIGR01509 family)